MKAYRNFLSLVSRTDCHVLGAVLALGSILLLPPANATAQCEKWLAGPLSEGVDGANDWVSAMTIWDPDGPGPKGATLVVGGSFTSIQGVAITHLAMRDPDTGGWVAVSPVVPAPIISALTVWDGKLVVGTGGDNDVGTFDTIVRTWDGSTWTSLAPSNTGSCSVLHVHNGQLYAGGSFRTNFTVLGTNPAHCLARWNPAADLWENLNTITIDGSVFAMASWGADLIVGGSFDVLGGNAHHGIARWDGANWHSMGLAAGSVVLALQPYLGGVYAGGFGLSDGVTSMGGLGRWNNGWSSTGWNLGGGIPLQGSVNDMTVYNGRIFLTGSFAGVGGSPNVALFDGGSYSGVGNGIGSPVSALMPFGGVLYVGGNFTTADATPMNHMALWNGTGWSKVGGGTVGGVLAMTNFMGQLVGGGDFSQSVTGQIQPAIDIVGWNGTSLSAFGSGMNAQVNALKAFKYPGVNGDFELIAGGYFTTAGGVSANRIARWDVDPILAFPPPAWQPMGVGFNEGAVLAIERFNGVTYAGGSFWASGGTALASIGRWNESTDTWENFVGSNGVVYAMKVFGPYLYVGGSFTAIGGISTGGLARWDGVSWSNVGGFFLGSVYALEVYNGVLVIGGDYTGINASPDLAYYTGTGYGTFGFGAGSNQSVTALHASGGRLYVGGPFTTLAGVSASHIAYYDGGWHGVSGGLDNTVYAMGTLGNEVHAGGTFIVASPGVLTKGWARYSATGVPWFLQQPFSQNVSSGATVNFTARPSHDYGQVTLQWYRKNAPAVNGQTGTGSTISGANDETLTLLTVSPSDAGEYKLVVTHACGTITSNVVTLTVDGVTAATPSLPIGDDAILELGPNPSSGAARMSFALARDARVRLRIFDVTGRLIRKVEAGALPSGPHSLTWDGRGDDGQAVRAGLYFVGLEAGGRSLGSRRLVIQR